VTQFTPACQETCNRLKANKTTVRADSTNSTANLCRDVRVLNAVL